MVVTSPPYDSIRSYENTEWNFEIFSEIAVKLGTILKQGGVIVWVVGDATIKGSETGTSFRQALFFKDVVGLNIHDTMIYEKNGASYPAGKKSVRYSSIFEYMFVFSKGKPKTINLIKDKPNRWAGNTNFGTMSSRQKDGSLKRTGKKVVQKYGYRNNIWRYNVGYMYTTKDKFAYEHPAMFPEQLARDHIITWSNEGNVVLDPMCGSGTVGKMANLLNRNFIGIEKVEKYYNIAKRRLNDLER